LIAKQDASVVVPTLNHRLGAVRVSDASADVIDFAHRLAGIGFAGLVVIDPLESESEKTSDVNASRQARALEVLNAWKQSIAARKKPAPKPTTAAIPTAPKTKVVTTPAG